VCRTLVALRRAIEGNHESNRIETGHFRGVTHIAFTPDDQALYSVGGDGDIKRWSLDGKLLSTIETEHIGEGDGCDAIQNFAVSPDGKMIATLGNEGTFVLWNTEGKKISSFDSGVERMGEDQYCTGILDSKISFASRTVTIRDSTQQSVWTFNGGVTRTPMEAPVSSDQAVNEKVTNKDGTLVASSSDDGTITVKGFPKPVATHRVVGLHDGGQGRVIRQEQEGLLLIIDQRKLSGKSRAEARRLLQEAADRLQD